MIIVVAVGGSAPPNGVTEIAMAVVVTVGSSAPPMGRVILGDMAVILVVGASAPPERD